MSFFVKFKGMEPIPALIVFSSKESIESFEDLQKVNDREVIEIHFGELTDFDTLMEAYRDDNALSEITLTSSNDEYVYYDYIIRVSLSLKAVESETPGMATNHWIMKLAQLTEVDKRLRQIVDTINKSPSTMTLEEYKAAKIDQSKEMLEKFLYTHPLVTNAKNDIFAEYTATTDKQNQFISQIITWYFNSQMGIEDTIYWNERSKPCTVWSTEECVTFMNAMKAYTKPLVTAQQQFEVAINNCKTKAEVEATNIDYNTVVSPNGRKWWVGYTSDEVRRLIDYYGDTDEKPSGADKYLHPDTNNEEETDE